MIRIPPINIFHTSFRRLKASITEIDPYEADRLRELLKHFSNFCRFYSNCAQEKKKIIVITGCDSGLGYSLSLKCNEMGYTVVSGCLDLSSAGAKALSSRAHVFQLDVRSLASIKDLKIKVDEIIESQASELHAVVNNAGIMIFGEFEWLTEEHVMQQFEVNAMGAFRIAKQFFPLLRKYKGRLINITSHCSISNLPCLSVYGATKAAIQSWSEGIRVEQAKYGVKVITFLPGSLAMHSNIMSRQEIYAKEMEDKFTSEQKDFYLDYFKSFNIYLSGIVNMKREFKPIEDKELFKKFADALTNPNPKPSYKHEPLRYFFYYNLFRFAPIPVRDYFVNIFTKFPSFQAINRKKKSFLKLFKMRLM